MAAPDLCAVHLLIGGRVQGVGYRAGMLQQARAAGLHGWVRNLRDGRVEAHVQGPHADVQALLAWCHRGPAAARVDAVGVTPADAAPALATFVTRATA